MKHKLTEVVPDFKEKNFNEYDDSYKLTTDLINKSNYTKLYRLSQNIPVDKTIMENLNFLDIYLLVKNIDKKGISFHNIKTKEGIERDTMMYALLSSNVGLIFALLECEDVYKKENLDESEINKYLKIKSEDKSYIGLEALCNYDKTDEEKFADYTMNLVEFFSNLEQTPTQEEIINLLFILNKKRFSQINSKEMFFLYNLYRRLNIESIIINIIKEDKWMTE